ncbi:MAG TPA: hypothetical protein VL588_05085 [Bdellovibrionota bacterium]|nr:hypothetical protein [Bdellovibrionota bacterium]
MFIALIALLTWGSSIDAHAAGPMIEVDPIDATGAFEFDWFSCPCFRWTVQVKGMGGMIETKDFLISSDALVNFITKMTAGNGDQTAQLVTLGAMEALWKGGHIGVGFDGVTVGDNVDMAYNDILKTGLYAIINILRTGSVKLDVHTGYDFEQMSINTAPAQQFNEWVSAAVMDWHTGIWSGRLTAQVVMPFDSNGLSGPGGWSYGADLSTGFRVLKISDIAMTLGLGGGVSYDPFRQDFGLEPLSVSGRVFMELSWVDHIN